MNNDQPNHDELHLHPDPDTQRIESLLDAIGNADRDAMDPDSQARVLDAVSQVFAPAPIAIEQQGQATPQRSGDTRWSFRIATAAAIAGFATLGIVISQPWKNTSRPNTPAAAPNQGTWTLASFEADLNAYYALEDELSGTQIDEAVADWELWAQTIEADFNADTLADDLGLDDLYEGAI